MTDGSKKRLGGWTRLWLVFSAVWVVGCSVVFFNTAPERDSVELSLEELDQYRVDQIVQALKSEVEGIYPLDYFVDEAERELEEEDRLALGEEIGTAEPELEGEAAVIALAEVTASGAGRLCAEQNFVLSAALGCIKVPSGASKSEIPV